MEQLMAV